MHTLFVHVQATAAHPQRCRLPQQQLAERGRRQPPSAHHRSKALCAHRSSAQAHAMHALAHARSSSSNARACGPVHWARRARRGCQACTHSWQCDDALHNWSGCPCMRGVPQQQQLPQRAGTVAAGCCVQQGHECASDTRGTRHSWRRPQEGRCQCGKQTRASQCKCGRSRHAAAAASAWHVSMNSPATAFQCSDTDNNNNKKTFKRGTAT